MYKINEVNEVDIITSITEIEYEKKCYDSFYLTCFADSFGAREVDQMEFAWMMMMIHVKDSQPG